MRTRVKRCCVPKHVCYCDCKKYNKGVCGTTQITSRRDTNPTWAARNSSSNVAAALHPDIYHSTAASDTDESGHVCGRGVRRKHCLGDNGCYCNRPAVQPSILPRPRTCIIRDDCETKPSLKIDSLNAGYYKVIPCRPVRQPLTARLRRLQEETEQRRKMKHEPLRYSRCRENYEHVRDVINEEYEKSVKRYEEQERRRLNGCYCADERNVSQDQFNARQSSNGNQKTLPGQDANDSPSVSETDVASSNAQQNGENGRYVQESDSLSGSKSPIENTSVNRTYTAKGANGNNQRQPPPNRRHSLDQDVPKPQEKPHNGSGSSGSKASSVDKDPRLSKMSHVTDEIYVAPKTRMEPSHMDEAFKHLACSQELDTSSSEDDRRGSDNGADAETWKQFRKQHYPETHATEHLEKSVPEHTCVHRFTLDERLFPLPANSDAYGTSRCIICDKIMPVEKTVFRDQRLEKKTFPNYYQYGRHPVRINMGAEGVKIVVGLGDKDAYLVRDWYFKNKKPVYANTHALRYQKGAY